MPLNYRLLRDRVEMGFFRVSLIRMLPRSIFVLPVLFEGQVKAVIELATVGSFTDLQKAFLEQLTGGIGIVLNSIEGIAKLTEMGRSKNERCGANHFTLPSGHTFPATRSGMPWRGHADSCSPA